MYLRRQLKDFQNHKLGRGGVHDSPIQINSKPNLEISAIRKTEEIKSIKFSKKDPLSSIDLRAIFH